MHRSHPSTAGLSQALVSSCKEAVVPWGQQGPAVPLAFRHRCRHHSGSAPLGGSVQTFPSLWRLPWLCQIPTGTLFQGPLALYNWVFNDILQVSFSSFVSLNSCKLEESHGCFSLSYLSSGLGKVLRLCEVGWYVGVEKEGISTAQVKACRLVFTDSLLGGSVCWGWDRMTSS